MSIFRRIALPLLVLLSMQLLVSCNMFRPDKRDDLSRYEITVEVDGKRYVIERTIQNWITFNWDTNQGASSGRRTDYGIFGQRIHDNQAIVIAFDYRKKSKPEDYTLLDDGTYVLSEPELLKHEFDIYLLDHYKDPQVIEMYDRIEAFDSSDARVKVIKKTYKKIPKIPFWPFQADGKDRYYDYNFDSPGMYSKDAEKNFEIRSYFKQKITDKSIRAITTLYPDIEPKGVYRLRGSYTLGKDGHYKLDGSLGYKRSKILDAIKTYSPCEMEGATFCNHYTGHKVENQWVMIKGKTYPIKAYRKPETDTLRTFDLAYIHEFDLNGEHIKINNDPLYSNSFIDFDAREYTSYQYYFHHTREHK